MRMETEKEGLVRWQEHGSQGKDGPVGKKKHVKYS